MDATFGHALYYPYINIKDENWLKVAALYYDGLSRIVPEHFDPGDSNFVKELNENLGFITNISPGWSAAAIVHDFITFAKSELVNAQKRGALTRMIGKNLPSKSTFTVHVDKMDMLLRSELPKLGLAKDLSKSDIGQSGWFEFEPVTGALYMTFLANSIAESRGLPIVTDDLIYQPLIRHAQADQIQKRTDSGHALASLVISAAIPQQIENISINDVIQFRKNHNDERHQFYEGVRQLVKDIPNIEDSNSLQDCLDHHKKTIDIAVKDLKLSFKSVGISCTTGLLGLSVPSWATKIAEFQTGIGVKVFAGTIIGMAIGTLMKEGINYYKSRRQSQWAYVLSLKKLNPKSLSNNLLGGTALYL